MEKALSLNLSWSWSYVFSLTTGSVANKSNDDWYEQEKYRHKLHFISLALNFELKLVSTIITALEESGRKLKSLWVQSVRKIYYSKQKLALKNWRDEKLKNWINEESTHESVRKTFYHNHVYPYRRIEELKILNLNWIWTQNLLSCHDHDHVSALENWRMEELKILNLNLRAKPSPASAKYRSLSLSYSIHF